MNDNENSNSVSHPIRHAHREMGQGGVSWVNGAESARTNGEQEREEREFFAQRRRPMLFSPWPFVEMLIRSWHWLALGGVVLAGLGFVAGMELWQTRYTANAHLLRFETPNNSDYFKPRPISEQTFASLLRSPELLQNVGALAKPSISPDQVASSLNIIPERNSDLVTVGITASDPKMAVNLANLFANEAVAFSKQLQTNEAREANAYYQNQLTDLERERGTLVEQMQHAVRESARAAVRPSQLTDKFRVGLSEKLQAAREELINLLVKYREAHPAVKEQNARIDELQKELDRTVTNATANADQYFPPAAPGSFRRWPTNSIGMTEAESEFEIRRTQLQALEAARAQLTSRQREAQLFQKDPPGYARLLAPATLKEVVARDRLPKLIFLTVFGGLMGVAGTALLLVGVEFMDDRLKTGSDVERVTGLPLLAALPDLHHVDQIEQENWAFRTWTALQNRLTTSPNHGLVCGFISAEQGEGRTTWVSLLANAAANCGFRVLTIATLPPSPHSQNGSQNAKLEAGLDQHPLENALTTNFLSSPALVTDKLTRENPQPLVHIPLPGWVWDLDRRKQWQTALTQWSKIENVVILVELPPASRPESVLLAENLPNLVWLTGSGVARASQSHLQLETLRHARSNLVGAVLNREPAPPIKKRFQRWMGCMVLLLGFCFNVRAAETDSVPATLPAVGETVPTNGSFSIISSRQRAAWQQHLTLGPGDVLNFSLFGQPEFNHTDVFIGPDGRVSFLQAQDMLAAGLTVDELRSKFDEELGKYYRTPHTLITPVSYHSKKYYVLGKVANRGVFTLDRPLTIVEALARAKGLETGLLDNRTAIDLADLQRSFLMRQGRRLTVNFEKLFQEGDLSQNIPLEPEDYLYFAAANMKEVYVLGEVAIPGPLPYTGNLTAVGAITARGGFTQRAYKSHVLVIRGSLNHPQTFVVNTWKTLEARAFDFKLEPKDIVYVNYRPFIKAEDLLDLGVTAFIQGATAEWAGKNIGPLIKSPFLLAP